MTAEQPKVDDLVTIYTRGVAVRGHVLSIEAEQHIIRDEWGRIWRLPVGQFEWHPRDRGVNVN